MTSWPKNFARAAAAGLVLSALTCGDNGGPTSVDGPGTAPKGLASCGSAPFLTAPLVPSANIALVVPLGQLNPPSHTMPTDHVYFYMSLLSPISVPSAAIVTTVVSQTRSGGGQPTVADYEVFFFPCADVRISLGHVASLFPRFSAKVGAIDGECRPSTQTGGFTYQQCLKNVNVNVSAGEAIGMSAASLDVWARDRRVTVPYVNQARLSDATGDFGDKHVACVIDYYEASIADQLRSKLGSPKQPRTTPPVCGTVMHDLANTASGRWFRPGSPTYPEDPHLALAHDNYQPALAAFSVGTSIPSLPTGVYTFTPASTGRVNLDFQYVTTIGETECYSTSRNQRVLLQLVSASRLRVEGIGPGACGDPATWVLGAGAVEFER